jgi:hypothetical protein
MFYVLGMCGQMGEVYIREVREGWLMGFVSSSD